MIVNPKRLLAMAVFIMVVAAGCASTTDYEKAGRAGLRDAHATLYGDDVRSVAIDGSLDAYVAYAMANSPALRAAYEDWRASVHGIARARRLPDPTISYGLYVQRVETRVGAQRHKASLRQMIPWPSKLDSGADALSKSAEASERRFDAARLALRRKVATAYWKLWSIRQTRTIRVELRDLLTDLSESVRIRVEIGQANLADLAQVDLNVSRVDDSISELDEAERKAIAALGAAIGDPALPSSATIDPPPRARTPTEDDLTLRRDAHAHPALEAFELMAESSESAADRARADGKPNLMFGLDYIETGPAVMPNTDDSGKDAIVVSVGVSIPLWRGSYAEEERKAEAQAAAHRARGEAATDMADAELETALSHVADTSRRIRLYTTTLIPQAETVYEAVVSAYNTADSTLANVLLAHRDLLELRTQLIAAQMDQETAWAHLEHVVGRTVPSEDKP